MSSVINTLVGKWSNEGASNFDTYLRTIGMDASIVDAAAKADFTSEWSVNGDEVTYTVHTDFTGVKVSSITFKLGQEFTEQTPGGRNPQTTYRVEGMKLVKRQVGKPYNCTVTLELENNDALIETMVCESPTPVVSVRKFKRLL